MDRTESFLILEKMKERQEMRNKHECMRKGWAWEKGRRLTDGSVLCQELRCMPFLGFLDRNLEASLV